MLQTIQICASPTDLGNSVAISKLASRDEPAQVDRHIAEAEAQVARQSARIAQAAAVGQNTIMAEALLGTMKALPGCEWPEV